MMKWIHLDSHGFDWIYMDPKVSNGFKWIHMDLKGFKWIQIDLNGCN